MTTDWTALDVPAIASILEPDHAGSWAQVTAWEQASSLLTAHAATVRRERDRLAESWPPEKSPASKAYMARLDDLIASLTGCAEAAIANRDALVGVLMAMAAARAKVRELHEAWREYSRRDNTLHSFTAQGVVAINSPPHWARDLNTKAYAVTAEMDQAVFEYTQKFVVVPYNGHGQRIPSEKRAVGGTSPTASPRASISPLPWASATSAAPGGPGHLRGSPLAPGDASIEPGGTSIEPDGTPSANSEGPRLGSTDLPAGPLAAAGAGLALAPMMGRSRGVRSERFKPGAPPGREGISSEPPATGALHETGFMPPIAGRPSDHPRRKRQPGERLEWNLPTGVSSIIAPVVTGMVHNPGPNVIGIDR